MEEEKSLLEGIPGTAQIRKIGNKLDTMDLLRLSEKLAVEGYDKKLFAVLSRVYDDKKGFKGQCEDEEALALVERIIRSNISSELKMQCFTSFAFPQSYAPDDSTVDEWLASCGNKRFNIAGFFLGMYGLGAANYERLLLNKTMFKAYLKAASNQEVIRMYATIMEKEKKEFVTGAIRTLHTEKPRFHYNQEDKKAIADLTRLAFDAKEVFFTSKLMYCMAFMVPKDCLPARKELYEVLKISINYEERITTDFIRTYNLDFNISDAALCRYYLANKKTPKEKNLVSKFATHVMRVEDEVEKSKLIHFAFKRGGYFRMYAGIMQDGGKVDPIKMQRFHYSEEDVTWVKKLPGVIK